MQRFAMIDRRTHHFGWKPDLGDHRDFHLEQQSVRALLRRLKIRTRAAKLPESVDWREFCGPIEDQGSLPTCAAHACVALLQQFERRASGRLLLLSSLFAHWTAGRQELSACVSQRSLRDVLKAIVRSGVPPERYWPAIEPNLGAQPDCFAFSFQREFRNLRYVRVGPADGNGDQLLDQVRSLLAAGFMAVCGFAVCTCLGDDPMIPFPTAADGILGGQAVSVVGYNDKLRIRSDRGALLVRNSWSERWGDHGFGWLPYSYVRRRLASDFWTVAKPSWLRSGEFEMPRL